MSGIVFPPNPSDGMIFAANDKTYFKYSASTNTWHRLNDISKYSLATPLQNGLMASADYVKMEGLILPPPQSTITSDGCNIKFTSGRVGLYSTDESVDVRPNLDVLNKIAGVTGTRLWKLHENTYGYNFILNVDQLISELESRSSISYGGTIGKTGFKGDKGDAGLDNLQTGPVGFDGENGANASFDGVLRQEDAQFEVTSTGKNRAIVDITTECVNEEENYLVATRANIGNTDGCPEKVKWVDMNSPWLIVLDDRVDVVTRIQRKTTNDCSLACEVCSSSLYHMNIDKILADIEQRFDDVLAYRRKIKTDIVARWLQTLIRVFNEQKWALCCALENCRSRYRNQRERQYLETQRIQAAQADFSLIVDGIDDRVILDMDEDKECEIESEATAVTGDDECSGCYILVTLDPIANSGTIDNAFVIDELAANDYIAEIKECCIQQYVRDSYTGRAAIGYRRLPPYDPNGQIWPPPIEDAEVYFPDMSPPNGRFVDLEDAKRAYLGLTVAFSHAGGPVKLWIPDVYDSSDNSGQLQVCIRPASCYEEGSTGSDITFEPIESECSLYFAHIEWYERGWRIGACCGADVDTDGGRYLIVKRSVGVDMTCGGGESLTTDCVGKFEHYKRYFWLAQDEDDITEGLFRRIELGERWDNGDILYCYYNDGTITIYRDEELTNVVGQAAVTGLSLTVFGIVDGIMVLNETFPATDPFVFTITATEISGHPAIAWPTIDGIEFAARPRSGYTTFVRDDTLSDSIIEMLWNDETLSMKGDPKLHIPFIIFPSS